MLDLYPMRLLAMTLMGGLFVVFHSQVWADTPAAKAGDFLELLPVQPQRSGVTGRVSESTDKIRVELRAERTSALQPLERQMRLRGQELLAHSVCKFSPAPGKRLMVALRGIQVVHSYEQGGWMELALEIPRQTPICEIRDISVSVSNEKLIDKDTHTATTNHVPSPAISGALPSATRDAEPISVQRNQGAF
jgi:hypothetical protein